MQKTKVSPLLKPGIIKAIEEALKIQPGEPRLPPKTYLTNRQLAVRLANAVMKVEFVP